MEIMHTPTHQVGEPGSLDASEALQLRGKPPVRDESALAEYMHTLGVAPEVIEATYTWLMSGDRESVQTRRAYARDLSWWLRFCFLRGTPPTQARGPHADQYLAALRNSINPTTGKPLARATIARRLAAVSSWYRYLHHGDYTDINPFMGMERPKTGGDTSPTRYLSREELAALVDYTCTHGSTRNCALLWLMVGTGGRVGTVIAARIEDMATSGGHTTIDITTKGGDIQRFDLQPEVLDAVQAHLDERGNPQEGPLVASRNGKPLDQGGIYETLQRLASNAGVPNRISPHSIRHTVASIMLEDGTPLGVVQEFLNHSHPGTTKIYDHSSQRQIRRAAANNTQKIAEAIDRRHAQREG